MAVYPAMLRLAGRRCLIVGGGTVAERKADGLLAGGADRLELVGLSFTPRLQELARQGRLELRLREYRGSDLDGVFLIVAATDDASLNARIGQEAERQGRLFNDASGSAPSSFETAAAVREGSLLLAVHAGGEAPALAAVLRSELELRYGGGRYAEAARRMGELRRMLLEQEPDAAVRRERLRREARRLADWAAAGDSPPDGPLAGEDEAAAVEAEAIKRRQQST
ncbi:bifunctional precorrin-2 dehydrogenase/sirohydrochlorin ferrochelatase [Paenibacillus albicereus]|uniref:precorrin-2 dehydrogenase n=1 Tax=Paenibacillus albicereus TaxID=2726185 RepID=A0A6H2GZX2_9BACL|nr:bifunctional precorrin-2 dehydrogenase/sirohydrochlorin ferrochelatase [Paenibacillus albicereus]QJC52955.1 bifunctional precorrin-2 dehydrogenase/sirohydrochlorin ferrochelatase [Paenibacillus albicereus]